MRNSSPCRKSSKHTGQRSRASASPLLDEAAVGPSYLAVTVCASTAAGSVPRWAPAPWTRTCCRGPARAASTAATWAASWAAMPPLWPPAPPRRAAPWAAWPAPARRPPSASSGSPGPAPPPPFGRMLWPSAAKPRSACSAALTAASGWRPARPPLASAVLRPAPPPPAAGTAWPMPARRRFSPPRGPPGPVAAVPPPLDPVPCAVAVRPPSACSAASIAAAG
mmetsp:Transcript_139169/g.388294  ORF Transcript_139169/g.388294 Transcript_139169/m.388294 type:complete len:223 (-) Transcript_139169:310-978(-)